MSKVYINVDTNNRIIGLDGGYSIANVDVDTWILIDEGEGDKYNLCQTHYLEKSICEEHGVPRYKYTNGEVIERTAEEILADIEPQIIEPSVEERISDLESAVCELYEAMV